jgi:hypothetical protein
MGYSLLSDINGNTISTKDMRLTPSAEKQLEVKNNKTMGKKTYTFEKDLDSKWYIILPEWTGDRSELEMVCGADVMLDILSQGESRVDLTISRYPFKESNFTLTFDKNESEGGWYNLKSDFHEFPIWLCHVTKFVFGELPHILYCC